MYLSGAPTPQLSALTTPSLEEQFTVMLVAVAAESFLASIAVSVKGVDL
jgi:hypothetical protein